MTVPTDHRRAPIRLALATAGALVATLLMPAPAQAIVYGVPDDGEHPNVGSFVMLYDPGTGEDPFPVQLCTGTLVSARVVLTASHCMQRDEIPAQYVGDPWFTLDEVIDADGDWQVDAGVERLDGTAYPHPLYAGSSHYRYDVGAFVLDEPVTGIAPAVLAPVGTLESRAVRSLSFETVGYGIVRQTNKKSTQSFLPPQRRMKAQQSFSSLNRDFVTFSMNLATGNGGTCYGDSGGPHFDPAGRVVAITTTGDIPCKAIDQSYRVDTRSSQDFVLGLVRLHG